MKVRFFNQCFCSSKFSRLTVFILTKKNQNSVFAIDHFPTEIVDHAQKIRWITTETIWDAQLIYIFCWEAGKPPDHIIQLKGIWITKLSFKGTIGIREKALSLNSYNSEYTYVITDRVLEICYGMYTFHKECLAYKSLRGISTSFVRR